MKKHTGHRTHFNIRIHQAHFTPGSSARRKAFCFQQGSLAGQGLMWKDPKVPKTGHSRGDSNWMHKACIKIETNKFIPNTKQKQKRGKTTTSKFSQTLSFFFDFLALSASFCSSIKSHLSCGWSGAFCRWEICSMMSLIAIQCHPMGPMLAMLFGEHH